MFESARTNQVAIAEFGCVMDTKSRKLFLIMRQHIHEICCHAFDGTNSEGNPVLGVVNSAECLSDPCEEISRLLEAMSVA